MSLHQHYTLPQKNNDIIDDNNITLIDVEKEVLPLTTSLEQQYSSFHKNNFCSNDDHVDDTNNT